MCRIGRLPGFECRPIAGTHSLLRQPLGVGVPAVKAVNQALNEAESSVRVTIPSMSARFAFVRSADAVARVTLDSVPHFAAA